MFLFAFNLLMNKKSLLNFKYLKNFQLCPIQLMLRCHPLSLSLFTTLYSCDVLPFPLFSIWPRVESMRVKCKVMCSDDYWQFSSIDIIVVSRDSIDSAAFCWMVNKMEIEEKSSSSATANDRERGENVGMFSTMQHTQHSQLPDPDTEMCLS